MNYTQYITRLSELMVEPLANAALAAPFQSADANAILPAIIDYAEQRMYRELDLIETITSKTAALTAAVRSVAMPAGVVVLQAINVITPAGAAPDDDGAMRNPLTRASVDFINYVFPAGTKTSVQQPLPIYYADLNNATLMVGPAPLAAYTIEVIGTIRPDPISPANPTTILSTYLPDLFLIASMIQASGYQKNWSAASDDPRVALSYDAQYKALLPAALVEIASKKSQGPAWRPYSPTPVAGEARQ